MYPMFLIIKGTVHPEMTNLSSYDFLGAQKEMLGRMTDSVTIHFHCMDKRCNGNEW